MIGTLMLSAPIAAKHLTFGFHETEDRLIILAQDSEGRSTSLLMTRRLTARLINALATVLERSNVVASTAPAEIRDAIVLMEHQGALTGSDLSSQGQAEPTKEPVASEPTKAATTAPALVSKIDVKTAPMEFHLAFHGVAGAPVTATLNRVDLHRVVDVLKRKAEAAEWNIPIVASWLEPGETQFVLN